MPLRGGDINKIPPGPGGSARLRSGACPTCTITAAEPQRVRDGPSCPTASAASSPGKTMPSNYHHPRGRHPRRATPPRPAPGVPSGSPALASGRTGAPRTACRPPSLRHRATWPATRAPRSRSGHPQARTGRTWRYRSGSCPAAAPGWRSLRSWARAEPSCGGPAPCWRSPRPGRSSGSTRPGRWTGRSRTWPPTNGQNRLRRLRIEKDAAGYTGLSGQISLDVLRSDSPSWPRDDQPQARQERQSPRPLPRPGPARPSVRALVLAGHRVHRAPAGTAAPHRRTGRAPARRPLPRRRDQD